MENEKFDALCELEFVETQTGKKVTVRLGSPVFDPMKDWYCCLTEITGLDEGKVSPVYGVNPFQAIFVSLKRFRVIFAEQAGTFRTSDGSAPYTVFPKEIPWVYGSEVYQRLCEIIDDEIQKIEDNRTR